MKSEERRGEERRGGKEGRGMIRDEGEIERVT